MKTPELDTFLENLKAKTIEVFDKLFETFVEFSTNFDDSVLAQEYKKKLRELYDREIQEISRLLDSSHSSMKQTMATYADTYSQDLDHLTDEFLRGPQNFIKKMEEEPEPPTTDDEEAIEKYKEELRLYNESFDQQRAKDKEDLNRVTEEFHERRAKQNKDMDNKLEEMKKELILDLQKTVTETQEKMQELLNVYDRGKIDPESN